MLFLWAEDIGRAFGRIERGERAVELDPENPFQVNSESAKGITNTVMFDSEFDPHPAIEQAWLVSGNEGFQKKLMMGNNPYSLDEYVEVPDGNLWDDSGLDNGRSFVNGGVYGNEPNPWLDFEKALESNLYEDLTFGKYYHPKIKSDEYIDSANDKLWHKWAYVLKSPVLEFNPKDDPEDDKYVYDSNKERDTKWKEKLRGEPVIVPKTEIDWKHEDVEFTPAVPGESKNSGYGEKITRGERRRILPPAYAYWVGDEGVKSKYTLSNLDAKMMARRVSVNDDNSTYKDHLRDGITVGTQPNFKFSDNSKENYWPGTGGFDITLDKEFNGLEDRVLSVGLLSKLDQQNQDNEADEIAAHYHSITTNSFGVLADVRNGGLKRDLSSAFLNDSDIGDGEWILEDEHPDIEESFDQSIYSHKEKLFKTVPLA